MLNPTTSRAEFRRSANRAMRRLERDGISISYDQMLEALSAAIGLAGWNQASALLPGDDKPMPTRPEAPNAGLDAPVNGETLPGFPSDWARRTTSNHGIHAFMGGPGGKSMMAARASLAWFVENYKPSGSLPRLVTISMGSRYKGFADLLCEGLPASARGQVRCWTPRLDGADRINAFDTPLGLRQPKRDDMTALASLLGVAARACGYKPRGQGMDMVPYALCSAAYRLRSDLGPAPTPYRAGCESVDAVLRRHGIGTRATWWNCVDSLMAQEEFNAAHAAQRMAMPTIHDLVSLSASDVAERQQRHMTSEDMENIEPFLASMRLAMQRYPALGGPSLFDASPAVVCIELEQRARPDPVAAWLDYLLVRSAVMPSLLPEPQLPTLSSTPHHIKSYHRVDQDRLLATSRRLVLDDMEHYLGNPVAQACFSSDMDRARKTAMSVCLVGGLGLLEHPGMCEIVAIAQQVRWSPVIDKKVLQKLVTLLHMPPGLVDSIQSCPPHQDGRGIQYTLSTCSANGIRHNEIHTVVSTPAELWAFATNPCDVALRERGYRLLGRTETRTRLAWRFPMGSAQAEIESRMHRIARLPPDSVQTGIIASLWEDIERDWLAHDMGYRPWR